MVKRFNLVVADVVAFTRCNGGFEGVFKDYTEHQLVFAIMNAIGNKSFGWSCDDLGNITGFAIGKPDYKTHTMHIAGILTVKDDGATLYNLTSLLTVNYKGWKLTGNRKGKLKVYNVDKLLKKLRSNARQSISL